MHIFTIPVLFIVHIFTIPTLVLKLKKKTKQVLRCCFASVYNDCSPQKLTKEIVGNTFHR